MAVNRVPILKRCRSLGLDPVYLGVDKKSNRELKSKIHLWSVGKTVP